MGSYTYLCVCVRVCAHVGVGEGRHRPRGAPPDRLVFLRAISSSSWRPSAFWASEARSSYRSLCSRWGTQSRARGQRNTGRA